VKKWRQEQEEGAEQLIQVWFQTGTVCSNFVQLGLGASIAKFLGLVRNYLPG
jgi:hypothetical protein